MNWFLYVLKNKYATFDGRARRKEYWMFFLFNFVGGLVFGFICGLIKLPALAMVWSLGLLIPGIAAGIRRLHDTGRSGWMMLLALVPCVGLIVLYWMVLEGTPGENQYGPNPKDSPDPV